MNTPEFFTFYQSWAWIFLLKSLASPASSEIASSFLQCKLSKHGKGPLQRARKTTEKLVRQKNNFIHWSIVLSWHYKDSFLQKKRKLKLDSLALSREWQHQAGLGPVELNMLIQQSLTSFSFLSRTGVCFLILFPVYATHFCKQKKKVCK